MSVLATRPELVTGREEWKPELLGGLYVSWPLFDSGAAEAEAAGLQAAAARLTARAEQLGDRSAFERRVAGRDLRRAAEDVRAGRENVVRAERVAAIARERYEDGIGLQLDVLEAEADVTAARGELLRALHRERSAGIELRRSHGLAADASLAGPAGGGGR